MESLKELKLERRSSKSFQRDMDNLQSRKASYSAILAPPLPRSSFADDASIGRELYLQQRCELLQHELDQMLLEYEVLTRNALFYESERTALDSKTDSLTDRIFQLEAEVTEAKVRLLGPRDSSLAETKPDSADVGTSTLRKEFRKLAAEMRKEQATSIKVAFRAVDFGPDILERANRKEKARGDST